MPYLPSFSAPASTRCTSKTSAALPASRAAGSRWLRESAQRRVAQKTDAAACIYDRCGQPKMPSWLSMLGSITWLEERVGQRRHDRDWRDEFLLLKMGPVENKLVGFAWPLELRELGWPPEHAEALAVLATWVDKLFNFRIHEFAASAWMVREALVHAAKRQPIHMSNAHPHLYAMLGRDGAPPFLKPDRGSDSRSDSQQQFPEVDVCCWNKLTRLVKGRYALSKLTSDQRATNFLRTDAITLATDGSTNAGWCGAASQATRYAMSSALSQRPPTRRAACVGVCGLPDCTPSRR